jgi:hypothetical protein
MSFNWLHLTKIKFVCWYTVCVCVYTYISTEIDVPNTTLTFISWISTVQNKNNYIILFIIDFDYFHHFEELQIIYWPNIVWRNQWNKQHSLKFLLKHNMGNFLLNQVLICYSCSQISKLCNIFKTSVSYLYIIIFMANKYVKMFSDERTVMSMLS